MVRPLVTPEGVDLRVELAEAGTRAAAFVIDALIMLAMVVVVTIVAAMGAGGLGVGGLQPLFVVWIVAMFLLRNVYFIAFEAGRRAATPGKRIIGIRVVSRDGSALSIDQVIARNLMREIEVFLPLSMLGAQSGMGGVDGLMAAFGMGWALLFAVFPMFNRDRLRIGDLLAGTWVVQARRHRLARELAPVAAVHVFTPAQLDAYGIAELYKLEEVLRGSDEAVLGVVAGAITRKIGWTAPVAAPRPFLIAYYGELRLHLERKLLLGNRRADKHAT